MKRVLLFISLLLLSTGLSQARNHKEYIEKIKNNRLMSIVDSMAHTVATTGFRAGDGYGEVWIRDYNTFIELSMEVHSNDIVKRNLNIFWGFQGETGEIVDGFIDIHRADLNNTNFYKYRLSKIEPGYAAHKNTVETDHEASLIQAIYKYVKKSGDYDYLQSVVADKRVIDRMEWALEYLFTEKFDSTYGLITGATTSDWGDVQPEHVWGVEIDENTHFAIDIYDNAMVLIAINNFIELCDDKATRKKWSATAKMLKKNIRKHLWDDKRQKFIPHIYLNGSPFPADFDENQIYYHGGTTMAIHAGLLTKKEIIHANQRMLENVKNAQAQTIGLTMYPPYPTGMFKGPWMYAYGYQNGGDWTWFGGRTIQALIKYGMIAEAYDELQPMLQRVVANNGFFEWYTPDGRPQGSGTFRGSAGVLHVAIKMLQEWAESAE
ncbi:MAG: hypothetical protein IJY36_02965 [Coprobacter sp.]|nr:hypothetical protein [Coprobacter sp.]